MSEIVLPPQEFGLPSKGLLYPSGSVFNKGTVEIKLPTALEEDILTNQNFIENGTVIDKFLDSIILGKPNLNELLTGDKNAIIIGSRILAYGAAYTFTSSDRRVEKYNPVTVDLTKLKEKEVDPELFKPGVNEFDFTLPLSKVKVTFKLTNGIDEKAIDEEISGLKKVNKNMSAEVSVRLKHVILSVNGDRKGQEIRKFVDKMPSQDSHALRKYIQEITPDYEMKLDYVLPSGETVEDLEVPMSINFFWPQ